MKGVWLILFCLYSAGMCCVGVGIGNLYKSVPNFTQNKTGWKIEHIPYPECPNTNTLSVDIPEHDEVNQLTVTCSSVLPNPKLGLDKNGRTEE